MAIFSRKSPKRAARRKPVTAHHGSLREALRQANRDAEKRAKRLRHFQEGPKIRSIQATIAEEFCQDYTVSKPYRLWRWIKALMILPIALVLTLAFGAQFLQEAVHRGGMVKQPTYWFFAVGMLMMMGWFFTGVFQRFFLYLYVLGHELTHAIFVLLCRGKVMGFHVSTKGGYITSNKSNVLISLSPYFVPFWSMILIAIYGIVQIFVTVPMLGERSLYALVGFTWTFHLLWTLWMIPRDQPDLRENGTFFSLAVIYVGNVLVLALLLCFATGTPWTSFCSFAEFCGDFGWRVARGGWRGFRFVRGMLS